MTRLTVEQTKHIVIEYISDAPISVLEYLKKLVQNEIDDKILNRTESLVGSHYKAKGVYSIVHPLRSGFTLPKNSIMKIKGHNILKNKVSYYHEKAGVTCWMSIADLKRKYKKVDK